MPITTATKRTAENPYCSKPESADSFRQGSEALRKSAESLSASTIDCLIRRYRKLTSDEITSIL